MVKTALILEDSKTQAMVIARMVEAQGWTTVHCDTVREALEVLKLIDIQALILDVFVGQHNSLLHIKQFRSLARSAPILLMTAGSSKDSIDDTLRHARLAGADYVLRKPFTEHLIKDIFESLGGGVRRRHILVIDDSQVVRRFAYQALASTGYRLSEAVSMEEAFSNVDIAHVDLVLCDVFMPGMGGLKGMKTIKATWPEVRIIAMSAGIESKISDREALNATQRFGADAQISKPFVADDLIHVMRQVLDGAVPAMRKS